MAEATWDALNRYAKEKGFCGNNIMSSEMWQRIVRFVSYSSTGSMLDDTLNGINSTGKLGIMDGVKAIDPFYLDRKRRILDVPFR